MQFSSAKPLIQWNIRVWARAGTT